MCACDTVRVSPEQGETTDPAQVERIAAKAAQWLPLLSEARVARAWAGMRTFAPDDRFVIGADPRLRGLYWAAGLGGHGITCAPMVGELTAQWIAKGGSPHPRAPQLAPIVCSGRNSVLMLLEPPPRCSPSVIFCVRNITEIS